MPSVKVTFSSVSLSGSGTAKRWYVWTRTAGGRRRQKLAVYLRQALADGRKQHAANVAAAAAAMGAEVDLAAISARLATPKSRPPSRLQRSLEVIE